MKFQYLGTAAAEGWPALFCHCEACQKAAARGGKNIRTRSQALIDDTILIDFPADTLWHTVTHHVPLYAIHTCLITHSHSDHLYPADLEMRRKGFAYFDEEMPLTFYGAEAAGKAVGQIIDMYRLDKEKRVLFQPVSPFQPFAAEGYTITPLQADHSALTTPVIYLIQGDKTILYAHDTGYFPQETWAYLEQMHPRLDFVSLDCNGGTDDSHRGHMALPCVKTVRDRLKTIGCTHEETRFCINHFSHNGGLIYDELLPIAEKEGFLLSYDGMVIIL